MRPLALGISGSSFLHVVPEEVARAVFITAQYGIPQKLTDDQNRQMVGFMHDMMDAMASPEVAVMESYHSVLWDREAVLNVILRKREVRNWSVHAPYGRCFDPSSPDPETRRNATDAMADAVHVASRLGAGIVVVHPGADVAYDVPRQDRLGYAVGVLVRVADLAGESGIRVAVEPLPKGEIGNTIDELIEVVDSIGRPNVGINFDVNHLFPAEQIPAMIRRAGSRLLSVHISDQDGRERHWLPFDGTMDWREALAALVDIGYKGPLIYETHIKGAGNCREVVDRITDNYRRLIAVAPEAA